MPSPTAGVGKWVATPPRSTAITGLPVEGLRAHRVPPWSSVQIIPLAMIGGPLEPVDVVHRSVISNGAVDTLTAVTPLAQGT